MIALEAEQALIGIVLYDDSAMPLVEHVRPEHFYEPLHSQIWSIILELRSKGQKPTYHLITPHIQGKALDDLGHNYLSLLCNEAPPSNGVGQYAQAVINAWQVRAIGTEVSIAAQMTDAGAGMAHIRSSLDFIEQASGENDNLIDAQSACEDMIDVVEGVVNSGQLLGLKCGLKCIDDRLYGLHPGSLIVIGGRPAMGKEQPIDTPVLTPSGWRTMGALSVGDYVMGQNGKPVRVNGVFPQGIKQAYKVSFRDGSFTECGLEHLWFVAPDGGSRKFKARTLSDILRIGVTREKRGNRHGAKWRIPLCEPIQYERKDLLIDPYLLGVLIGDGSLSGRDVRFSCSDRDVDIVARVSALLPEGIYLKENRSGVCPYYRMQGVGVGAFKALIASMGLNVLSGAKRVPAEYMLGSIEQRMALLAGLMDTDGHCSSDGCCQFDSTSKGLTEDVRDLVRSLGGTANMHTYDRTKEGKGLNYRLDISLKFNPFLTRRKAERFKPKNPAKYIYAVEKSRMVEQVCISVESEDHLYITTDYIVTHNTSLVDNISYGAAIHNPEKTFVFFNLEMDAGELSRRQLSAMAYRDQVYVQYRELKAPTHAMLSKLSPYKKSLPKNLLICDEKRVSVDYIRRVVWKLKAKKDIGAIFIDYLQIMTFPTGRGSTDARLIGEVTAELKRIAGETGICIVLLSQLSRNVEARDNKRPLLSDLKESGSIEQDANVVLFPYREHYYLKNEAPKDPSKVAEWQSKLDSLQHVMTVICAKARNDEPGDDHMYCSLGYDIVLNEPPYGGN